MPRECKDCSVEGCGLFSTEAENCGWFKEKKIVSSKPEIKEIEFFKGKSIKSVRTDSKFFVEIMCEDSSLLVLTQNNSCGMVVSYEDFKERNTEEE